MMNVTHVVTSTIGIENIDSKHSMQVIFSNWKSNRVCDDCFVWLGTPHMTCMHKKKKSVQSQMQSTVIIKGGDRMGKNAK